jgi:glycerol-3-phosphate dehydrogenase
VADETVDLLVVGGGINGAGIARDAAGRGLSVVLCEQGDLAGATSSASSKLIHGGLRYLEQYEFRLVREALLERERLLAIAPHIIWPLDFVLPHERTLRPAWLVRLGLFIYDHLAPRKRLHATRSVRLDRDPVGASLRPGLTRGFVYADCWVEDARLVVLNARDAFERGARVLTHTRLVQARRDGDTWSCDLALRDGGTQTVRARALVNAAGPWVSRVLNQTLGLNSSKQVRLIKGSHIVLPRLHDGPEAFILQNTDRRIVFAIPYEQRYTLVGTTDTPFDGDPSRVAIDEAETGYLLDIINRYFRTTVTAADIAWSYAGVRPLYDDAAADASAVTRDYVLDVEAGPGKPALLSVFGGKITTSRKLAEHALEKLAPHLPKHGPAWTATAPLPGGDMPDGDFDRFLAGFRQRHAYLPPALSLRLARAYGTRADRLLQGCASMADLGRDYGAGLHQREVAYLRAEEWAETAEDILWRRSKLGLHVPEGTAAAIDEGEGATLDPPGPRGPEPRFQSVSVG